MEIVDHIRQINLKQGDYIFREGDLPDGYMYFIFKGEISFERLRNQRPYAVNQSSVGEFFGEMAIVSKRPRALTAIVISANAQLGRIDKTAFIGLCKKNPMFTYKLIKSVVGRLGNAEDKIHRLIESLLQKDKIKEVNALNVLPVPLPPVNILNFVNNVPTRTLIRNELIISEGEQTDGSIFFLFEGELKIFKGDINNHEVIRKLYPGEFFGEISMISHKPFMASVMVVSQTARVARLDEDIFLKISRHSPEFLFLILQNMIGKLAQREDFIDRLVVIDQGGTPIQYGVPEEEPKPDESRIP